MLAGRSSRAISAISSSRSHRRHGMPGDPTTKLRPGDRITAEAFNQCLDAARIARNRAGRAGAEGTPSLPQPTLVMIRNDHTADVDRFGVLGVGVPLVLPSDDLDEFQSRVLFSGHAPTSTDTGRFVITLEPIPVGEIGRAVISGATVGKVTVTSGQLASPPKRAEVAVDRTTSLDLSDTGSAEVLWQETLSAAGEAWAILRLFGSVAAGAGGSDPDASLTVRGYVNTTTQSFAGEKTFDHSVRLFGPEYQEIAAVETTGSSWWPYTDWLLPQTTMIPGWTWKVLG